MPLKKAKNFKGIELAEAHYDVKGIRLDQVIDEEKNESWRVIVRLAMYSNADMVDPLEVKEYMVGNIDNKSLISYNKVVELAKLHEELEGAVDC